jgi:two-component system NtrC family sensor kinase
MMRNEPDEVRRIIETIGSQAGIDRIRVFDKQGKIQTSTARSEVGTLVDTNAEECYACHQRDQPLDRLDRDDRMRIFDGDDGRVMGIIAPIQNEADCIGAGCHANVDKQPLLGVLDVRLSLADVDQDLQASRMEMGLGLAGTALAILGLALTLSWSMVLRPVHRLTAAASRVTDGDLTATVPQTSSDEIGELSAAWNAMVQEVSRSRDRLEASGRELERKVQEKTAELNEAHEHMLLVEKMASLGKLAAVVAHEINNPLAGISTYAKLLDKRLEGDDQAAEDDGERQEMARILRLIDSEARRCGEIVRNLLLFSRSRSADFAPHEIPPLIQRCTMLVRHQAELAEVTLDTAIGADLPEIECDASQVQQMILALLMNAIEASEAGGVVSVAASFDAAADDLVLKVGDSGAGIPPEDLQHIFEPFFTTKQEGAGVGLGLAVVYGIVHRHRGHCDVESQPGSGTTFTVRMPRHQPAAAPDDAP